MTALSNSRHELFAQGLASGMTERAAYEAAGYKPDDANANKLTRKHQIIARVGELQAENRERCAVTVEAITKEFTDAIEKASADKAHAAVMAGIMGKAKLHGLIIDKARVEQGRLDEMSDAAIADDIERRLARLAERRAEGAGEADPGAGEAPEPERDRELSSVSEAVRVPRQGQDG